MFIDYKHFCIQIAKSLIKLIAVVYLAVKKALTLLQNLEAPVKNICKRFLCFFFIRDNIVNGMF